MTSLRSRLVDAGARAMHVRTGKPRGPIEPFILDAEAVLDAMLDVLAVNADDWANYYPAEAETSVWAHRAIIARKLVKALREDR